MPNHIPVTLHGIRCLIPKLAQTFEGKIGSRVSQKVVLQSADKHDLILRLREYWHVSSDEKFWRLDLNFAQIRYNEYDEAVKRDDDFCDAFAVYLGGRVGDSSLSLPFMTTDLRCPIEDCDMVPSICKILQKAVSAELCACGKQITAQNDEMCFRCMIGLEETDSSNLTCPICSRFMSRQSPVTSCCKVMTHEPCLLKCALRCPFCRTEPFALIAS